MAREEIDRYAALDALRGVAVLGIVLMNVIAFALPEAAYSNPFAWGMKGAADFWSWAVAFVLVDGKMRGLFSIMFGASMLLVYTRAEASGQNGARVHMRRMAWLFVFGLAHLFFLWDGDILHHYAVCGAIALLLMHVETRDLKRVALGGLAFNFLIMAIAMLFMIALRADALSPGASPQDIKDYRDLLNDFGGMGQAAISDELARMRGSWAGIVQHRFSENWSDPLILFMLFGAETIGLMAMGMLGLRNGFLTGEWTMARYRRVAVLCYAAGIAPLIGMAYWVNERGNDPVLILGIALAWSTPFRLFVTIGHAALAMIVIRAFSSTALMARIEAAGRTAFTNYLATSLVMTLIFYGYGFSLFGHVTRAESYLAVLLVWVLMLLWSKPWLERYRHGPLEWAWRSLARGALQPMRR